MSRASYHEAERVKRREIYESMKPPRPEVAARELEVVELPGGPKAFANVALRASWTVRATFSRGPWLNADGTVNRIADCFAVRAWNADGDRSAVAVWVTDAHGKLKAEFAWRIGQETGRASVGVKALKEWING